MLQLPKETKYANEIFLLLEKNNLFIVKNSVQQKWWSESPKYCVALPDFTAR